MAQVKAQLNNLRISPRKVRAIVDLIRGKSVNDALNQLEFMVKRSGLPVKKLINSALANAENNFNMVKDNLFIKSLMVDEGVKLKRFRAKGFGRAESIQKKTSNVLLVLEEKVQGLKREKSASKKEVHEHKAEKTEKADNVNEVKKPEVKREIGSKNNMLGGLKKKLFQRKAI